MTFEKLGTFEMSGIFAIFHQKVVLLDQIFFIPLKNINISIYLRISLKISTKNESVRWLKKT